SPEHVLDALVRSVAPGEELAAEKETLAGAPGSDLCTVEPIEIDAARFCIRGPRDGGPIAELRCFELRGPRAVEHEVRMARRGAVRDHRHRLVCRVCRIGADLDVEHGGEAAQALRADAERIHFVVELDAQLLGLVLRAAPL